MTVVPILRFIISANERKFAEKFFPFKAENSQAISLFKRQNAKNISLKTYSSVPSIIHKLPWWITSPRQRDTIVRHMILLFTRWYINEHVFGKGKDKICLLSSSFFGFSEKSLGIREMTKLKSTWRVYWKVTKNSKLNHHLAISNLI